MSTIAERVAAGAAFLDEREPGWEQYIDLDTLNIGSSCRCILGQLHGSYSGGMMAMGYVNLPENWDIDLGFMWTDAGKGDEATELTVEWMRVITGRRWPDE